MKIPPKVSNRSYELTCLLNPDYSQDELKEVSEIIQEVIADNGGEVQETEEWGKKDLAYKIKNEGRKYQQAHYLHFIFEAAASQATDIKEAVNMNENIIRYLLVQQEK